jgi:hypothetical protein
MFKILFCGLTTFTILLWVITMDVTIGLCANILVTCTLNSLNRE